LAILGRNRFYLFLQGRGRLARACQVFANSEDVATITREWREAIASSATDQRSPFSLERYSGPLLGGCLDVCRTHSELVVVTQRHKEKVTMPLIEKVIRDFDVRSVVEIGCARADDLLTLAEKYDDVRCVGVDFVTAPRRLPANVELRAGYALQLIERGELNADLLIAFGVFCHAGPLEYARYTKAITQGGFKALVISDPIRKGYDPNKYQASRHLQLGLWGHDHVGSFRTTYDAQSFRIDQYDCSYPENPEYQTVVLVNRLVKANRVPHADQFGMSASGKQYLRSSRALRSAGAPTPSTQFQSGHNSN
jgi:hypothetical protein